MVSKNEFLNSLDPLGILPWKKLNQVQEASLVLCLIVVAVLHLALQGRKLYSLLTCARMGPINDGITRLEEGGGGGREGGWCVCEVSTSV